MLYKDTQSHVDRGGSADHSNVGVGANLQLFQRLGHELWLGELSDLGKDPSP